MKRFLPIAAICAAFAISTAALEPSGFNFDVTLGGTARASDKRAMLLAVANENQARRDRNDTNALSTATAADLRASYKTVLLGRITAFHIDTMNAAVTADAAVKAATEDAMRDIRAAVIDQIGAGVSISNLVQALKAAK